MFYILPYQLPWSVHYNQLHLYGLLTFIIVVSEIKDKAKYQHTDTAVVSLQGFSHQMFARIVLCVMLSSVLSQKSEG